MKAIDSVEGLLPWFKSEPQYYAIQVTGQYYFPSLKAGWWMVCDEQAVLQSSGLACLYLINGLQLIVELISENQDSYQIQNLDESRKVSFQKSDVAKIPPCDCHSASAFNFLRLEIIQPIIRWAE